MINRNPDQDVFIFNNYWCHTENHIVPTDKLPTTIHKATKHLGLSRIKNIFKTSRFDTTNNHYPRNSVFNKRWDIMTVFSDKFDMLHFSNFSNEERKNTAETKMITINY